MASKSKRTKKHKKQQPLIRTNGSLTSLDRYDETVAILVDGDRRIKLTEQQLKDYLRNYRPPA